MYRLPTEISSCGQHQVISRINPANIHVHVQYVHVHCKIHVFAKWLSVHLIHTFIHASSSISYFTFISCLLEIFQVYNVLFYTVQSYSTHPIQSVQMSIWALISWIVLMLSVKHIIRIYILYNQIVKQCCVKQNNTRGSQEPESLFCFIFLSFNGNNS